MTPVDAHVGGTIRVGSLDAASIIRLREAFSYQNPEWIKLTRFGGHPSPEVPKTKNFVEEFPDGSVEVPRGAPELIVKALEPSGLVPKWIDERDPGLKIELPKNELPPLRPYQEDARHLLGVHPQGLVVLPCGGGKTTVGASAIDRIRVSTLVIVHTEDLLDQWVATLAALGVEPGLVKEGVADFRYVTVATVQTLKLHLEAARDAHFGLVILDEAHHAPAVTFREVLGALSARRRLGLTATPRREDGIPLLFFFGATLVHKNMGDLVDAGYLMKPEIKFVETSFTFTEPTTSSNKASKINQALARDTSRNALIARLSVEQVLNGESVLVLANRKDMCLALGRAITEAGVEPKVITGHTKKDLRKKYLEQLRSGEVRCVIATNLADEGLDVKRLSRIILALPERAEGRTMQRIGRIMRVFDGKVPELIDIVDKNVPSLRRRYYARRATYRELGLI